VADNDRQRICWSVHRCGNVFVAARLWQVLRCMIYGNYNADDDDDDDAASMCEEIIINCKMLTLYIMSALAISIFTLASHLFLSNNVLLIQ